MKGLIKNIIYITGYGVVSSLGIDKEETRKNLFDVISGISDITLKYADRNVNSALGGITKNLSVDTFFVENNILPDRTLVLAMLAVD